MTSKVFILFFVASILVFIGYGRFNQNQTSSPVEINSDADSTQLNKPEGTANAMSAPEETIDMMTLTGTYVCLPTLGGAATPDCAFGIKTDDGEYYAVNFGAGAGSMAGERISASGTFIPSAELKPNHWTKFQTEGLFTILEKL